MSEADKDEIKTEVLKRISEINESIAKLEELTKPIAPDVAIGRITRMEAITEKGINESKLRTDRQTLLKLEQTLDRIIEPDFGLCSLCKNPIPKKRIILMPESSRCVNCVGK